jgi:hypothetical protein
MSVFACALLSMALLPSRSPAFPAEPSSEAPKVKTPSAKPPKGKPLQPSTVDSLKRAYTGAIQKLNEDHVRKPGKTLEPELAKRLPAQAVSALEKLLASADSEAVLEALVACGESALDLDRMGDFGRIRARLAASGGTAAEGLGTALSRPRFILRGLGGLDDAYLERFAGVLDAILDAYDRVFGFKEWSKVPGKKIRVRVHRVEKIVEPPHFAPQFPYHSEIDFPVVDAKELRSPTEDGKFLFYGLCHELGHLIAMWGDLREEEDHHAWAHYTGVVIVEELSKDETFQPYLSALRDVRWRSLEAERKELASEAPSKTTRAGVLALLVALHDAVGPKALGDAMSALDAANPIEKRPRLQHVRYYRLKDFGAALLAAGKDPKGRKAAAEILEKAAIR